MLTPIQSHSIVNEVTEQLKKLILDGKIKPGDKFPSENELCEQLNVSRTVIREAKQSLTGMGLIETTRGKQTYVRSDFFEAMLDSLSLGLQLKGGSVNELMESRRIIEVAAAGLAAERADQKVIDELNTYLERQKAAMQSNDLMLYAVNDLGWHTTIAEATKNRVVIRMLSTIRNMLEALIIAGLKIPGSGSTAFEAHQRITTAIARGDAELAKQGMSDHLVAVRTMFEELKAEDKQELEQRDIQYS